MPALLEIDGLRVEFGHKPVVDDVSLRLEGGRTLALVGESGSGKSITALSAMRLLPFAARISQGAIRLDGNDLLKLPETAMQAMRGGRIGMIFQEPQSSLNPVMRIGDQIAETLRAHTGLGRDAVRDRVIELLEAVGISDAVRRYRDYPHQFSGGMKQRVMIAIAIAAEPDVLVADEPTTALDVTTQAQVLGLLRQLQRERGMSMLFITHDLAVAQKMADQVAVMRNGRVVEQGAAGSFFAAPGHEYSRSLFSALPTPEKRQRDGIDKVDSDAEMVLEVRDLKVHFPIRRGVFRKVVGQVRAVDGVSVAIRKGHTVAVVGESGSGKTTMGKGLLQLVTPTAGAVMHDDEDLASLSERELRARRSLLQIVFQDPFSSMNPRMMITDIIQEGMIAQGIGSSRIDREQRVDELLGQVGLLSAHKYRYPHEFSGGQRQRICIARALAVEPELIVCDEPTSALDVSVQAQILALLRELQVELGIAYLFITHNVAVVEYLAHEVIVMRDGRVVEQGSVDAVLRNPSEAYTRELLAAVPRLELPPGIASA
ncbi:MAG: ABC transporter ATP-binding protein [Gammaproteobacteria bacterium]|nr:dipeptide ABC transporter ATP-binding protein [Gammaproteobacteria bacterium]NNM00716.1 ABC transporter ATP-binding protein [Gammaproteobacteria bacterium]